MGYLSSLAKPAHNTGQSNLIIDYGVSMRSYYTILSFSVIFAVILSGCTLKEAEYGKLTEEEVARMPFADIENLPDPSGGVTLSVMSEIVTADDVVNSQRVIDELNNIEDKQFYELFAVKARPLVVSEIKENVSKKYIYHTAKKNAPSNIDETLKKMIEKEKNRHLTNYKNNYSLAEAAFKTEKEFVDMGVTDWKSFEEYKKMMIMVRMYLSKKVKKEKPINLDDMKNVYNMYIERKHPDFVWDYKLQMRVIDIQPDKLTPDEIDVASGETNQQAALRKGKRLVDLIKKGEDFGKLARENSHGIGKDNGGLWAAHIFGSRIKPYDVLDKAADKMNVGDVTDVIEADGHVFIMKLEDKRPGGTAPFTEVQGRIESEIRGLQQQYEYNKVLYEIIDRIDVKDMDVFTDYCLKRAFELVSKQN